MEAEKLLEGYVEKIHNLRPLKDKLNFFKYGFTGKFKTIRDDIIKLDPHKWDDRDAFIKICDNRIDRLKTFTTEIVTSVCALIAVVAVFLIAYPEKSPFQNRCIFLLIFVMSFLLVAMFYYRAQTYAWYAVKEGVLLVKDNQKKGDKSG